MVAHEDEEPALPQFDRGLDELPHSGVHLLPDHVGGPAGLDHEEQPWPQSPSANGDRAWNLFRPGNLVRA